MDVSRLNAVMETLRRQLSETERKSALGEKRAPTSSPGTTSTSSRPNLPQLRQRVLERVASIDPDDPQYKARTRRIFIESVLAWEFGEQLLSDRGLDELIEQVLSTMNSLPEIDVQLSELLSPGQPGDTR